MELKHGYVHTWVTLGFSCHVYLYLGIRIRDTEYVWTDTHVNLLCKLSVVCIPYGYSFVVYAFSALAYIQGLARKKIKVHLPFACQLCRTSEWGLKVDCYFNRVRKGRGYLFEN